MSFLEKLHILKINGHAVLNFLDLQEHFLPWDVYEQREAFAAFAKVHCCPLSICIRNESGMVQSARYLDKAFWLELLKKDLRGESPEELSSAEQAILQALEAVIESEVQQENARESIHKEMEAMEILQKLEYIQGASQTEDTPEGYWTEVQLLALCELAEIDVRKQDLQRWKQPEEPMATEPADIPFDVRPEIAVPKEVPQVMAFPQVDKTVLPCRPEPYRYRYHEADTLQGGKIQTVRVEASTGVGERVCIELCREDGTVVNRVTLYSGEYRNCNVAQGQVIAFLPTLSISDTLCIARKRYDSSEITVIPRGASEWALNIDPETSRKISCFAAGDNSKEGFLYLRNGRLMKSFYKPNENFTVRQQLEMIDDRLVEVRLTDGYYELLTELGEVLTNNPNRKERVNVITLYFRENDSFHAGREVVFSASGLSMALHGEAPDQCEVRFG